MGSWTGIGGFYRGLPPATTRAVFNNGLSLTIYKPMLRIVTGRSLRSRKRFESKLRDKIIAAFLTGSCTQLIANPVDVIKVRSRLVRERCVTIVPEQHS